MNKKDAGRHHDAHGDGQLDLQSPSSAAPPTLLSLWQLESVVVDEEEITMDGLVGLRFTFERLKQSEEQCIRSLTAPMAGAKPSSGESRLSRVPPPLHPDDPATMVYRMIVSMGAGSRRNFKKLCMEYTNELRDQQAILVGIPSGHSFRGDQRDFLSVLPLTGFTRHPISPPYLRVPHPSLGQTDLYSLIVEEYTPLLTQEFISAHLKADVVARVCPLLLTDLGGMGTWHNFKAQQGWSEVLIEVDEQKVIICYMKQDGALSLEPGAMLNILESLRDSDSVGTFLAKAEAVLPCSRGQEEELSVCFYHFQRPAQSSTFDITYFAG